MINVSFTTPDVMVQENVSSGSTEVCFMPSTSSAQPYTIEVSQMPAGQFPATCKFVIYLLSIIAIWHPKVEGNENIEERFQPHQFMSRLLFHFAFILLINHKINFASMNYPVT